MILISKINISIDVLMMPYWRDYNDLTWAQLINSIKTFQCRLFHFVAFLKAEMNRADYSVQYCTKVFPICEALQETKT